MKKILLLISLNITKTKAMQPQYIQMSPAAPQIVSYGTPDINANLKGWSWFVVNILTPLIYVTIGVLCLMIIELKKDIKEMKNEK